MIRAESCIMNHGEFVLEDFVLLANPSVTSPCARDFPPRLHRDANAKGSHTTLSVFWLASGVPLLDGAVRRLSCRSLRTREDKIGVKIDWAD